MKTVIIDEQEIVHSGVREFLANSSFEVVAHCATLLEYLEFIASGPKVELILTDVTVAGIELKRVIESIKKQSGNAKLIVFSDFEDEALIQQAEELGADGCISKNVSSSEFIDKLQDLKRYGNIWSSTVA